jgi:hypothetical protein
MNDSMQENELHKSDNLTKMLNSTKNVAWEHFIWVSFDDKHLKK